MRRESAPPRFGLAGTALTLAGLCIATGCTHNHYYYGDGTPAVIVPGGETVIYDEVCALPGPVVVDGDSLASDIGTRPSAVDALPKQLADSSGSSRVIISRPSGPFDGRGWQALGRDDQIVTTKVQGGADASTLR